MKFNTVLPYPVLNKENDNYIDSRFDAEVIGRKSFGELHLEMQCNLDNKGIEELIRQEKATYVLHVECSQTSYRTIVKSHNSFVSMKVNDHKLRGKIDIHPFIVATAKIENYFNDKLSDFYKGIPVTFEKGNMLATAEPVEIILHEDPIETQNLPSIVTVRRVEKGDHMNVQMSSDQIMIELPKKIYDNYSQNAGSRLKDTILAMVIAPCLIDVFYTLKEDSSGYEEYKWYQVLVQIFNNNHIPLTQVLDGTIPVLQAVQLVLRNPLEKAFIEIEKVIKEEE